MVSARLRRLHARWERLSFIGQTYGAASALVAAVAIADLWGWSGPQFSIWPFQHRDGRAEEAFMQDRANQLTLRPTTAVQVNARALTDAFQQRRAFENARLAANREILRREALDGGYSRAETTVTPGELAVNGDVATLQVSEFTKLYSLEVSEADRALGYDWSRTACRRR